MQGVLQQLEPALTIPKNLPILIILTSIIGFLGQQHSQVQGFLI